jgi:hypothetical protein
MFPKLKQTGALIEGKQEIKRLFHDPAFDEFNNVNVLPLIYDEKQKRCNILVFDYERAKKSATRIVFEKEGKGRKHPVYRFYDGDGDYICEVRYGSGTANALQRGLWTHTKNGLKYFDSVTNGWIDYSHNLILVKVFSHALLATAKGHEAALVKLKEDIEEQKQHSTLK